MSPGRFCIEDPLKSLDLLFDEDADDEQSTTPVPCRRKSAPAMRSTALPGGRRMSTGMASLPGNDWMKPFSAPTAEKPAASPEKPKVPPLLRLQSAPAFQRSKSALELPRRQSLTELIDAEHPGTPSQRNSQRNSDAGETLPGLRKRRSSGAPAPLQKRNSSWESHLGDSDEDKTDRRSKRVSFGVLPPSRRASQIDLNDAEDDDEAEEEEQPAWAEDEWAAPQESPREIGGWDISELPMPELPMPFGMPEQMPFMMPEYGQMPGFMPPMQPQLPMGMGADYGQMMQMQMQMQMQMAMAQQFMAQQQPQMMPMMAQQPMMMPMMVPMMPQMMGQQPQMVPMMAAPQPAPAVEAAAAAAAVELPHGRLLAAAKEAKGSRWLQGVLSRLSASQLEEVAEELKPELYELSRHPFGNYVVSRLAHLASLQPALVAALRGHVFELQAHPQGSRVLQAALKALPDDAAAELVAELRGRVVQAAADTHGSWLVCAAFERTLAPFMLEEVSAKLGELALMPHGGRVVQEVITCAAKAGLDLRSAVDALLRSNVCMLAMDPYANYNVQLALKHGAPAQRRQLTQALLPQLLDLATSKHGSNVAEVLLAQADAAQLHEAAQRVLAPAAGGARGVQRLCNCCFGNYVLQTLIRKSAPEQRTALLGAVRRASTDHNFARIVLSRLGEPEC